MTLRTRFLDVLRRLDALIADHSGPVRLLFIVRDLRGFAIVRPIIEEACARPRISLAFTLESDSPLRHADVIAECRVLEGRFVPARRAEFAKWHYVFLTEVTGLRMRRWATHFVLHHGQIWGNVDRAATFGPEGKFPDYTLKMSRQYQVSMRQVVSRCEFDYFARHAPDLVGSPNYRAVIMGVPKLDRYRRATTDRRNALLQDLGLDPRRRTVVVTSHWIDKGLFLGLGWGVFASLLRHEAEFNVIVLGHEKLWRDAESGLNSAARALRDKLRAAQRQADRLVFLPCMADQLTYLALADLFVCDNSSAFVECLVLDRPVLLFEHPEFEFEDPNVGHAYRMAGARFSDCEGLAGALDDTVRNPDSYAQGRRDAIAILLARVGHSTRFFVDLVESMGRLSGPRSSRWRCACKVIDQANADLPVPHQQSLTGSVAEHEHEHEHDAPA